MKNKISLTTQNRLIIFGLLVSTVLIIAIAIFAIFNIQKKLNEGYQNFGQVISKTLAIESVEITKNLPADKIQKTLREHSESILKSHNDIVFIEFRDNNGELIYSGKNELAANNRTNIRVTSPLASVNGTNNIGSVTVGLSGNIVQQIKSTTRASLLFVFLMVWIVFAFVILINTYLITRELRILQEGVKNISTKNFGYKI